MPACQVLVHDPTLQNGLRAIYTRIFCVKDAKTPGGYAVCPEPITPNIFTSLHRIRREVVMNTVVPDVVPLEAVASMYNGRKKQIYDRAFASLCETPVERKDANIRAFTKKEKLIVTSGIGSVLSPAPLESKDPRIIQPRNPRYNLVLASYLKTLEHRLFQGIDRTYGHTTVFKGLNAVDQGTKLAEAWAAVSNPVGIRMDFKRFDQHVSREALMYEHSFYVNCYRKLRQTGIKVNTTLLKELLSWQLNNRCVLRVPEGTIRYKTRGKRMSGDNNTGLGNVVLVCTMFLLFLREVGIDTSECRLVNNGDDSVLIVHYKDVHLLGALPAWFIDYGFEMVVEPPVTVVEEIEFCQSRPVVTAAGWVMCRNYPKCVPKDMITTLPIHHHERFVKAYAGAISDCGLALCGGIPCLQNFYLSLNKYSEGHRGHITNSVGWETGFVRLAAGVNRGLMDITSNARVSFWKAFGVLPDQQSIYEEYFIHCMEGFSGHVGLCAPILSL